MIVDLAPDLCPPCPQPIWHFAQTACGNTAPRNLMQFPCPSLEPQLNDQRPKIKMIRESMERESFDTRLLPPGKRRPLRLFKPFPLPLQVAFRFCERRDLRSLEWHGLFTAHRRIIQSAFRAQQRGHNMMVIAEVNGAPIGQVWISFRQDNSELTGLIWALRVIPWLQGLGLGSRLVQVAEQVASARACTFLELGVEKYNKRARKLYERLGFKTVGQIREEYRFTTPSGRSAKMKLDEYLMRKPLPSRPTPRADLEVLGLGQAGTIGRRHGKRPFKSPGMNSRREKVVCC